MPAMLTQATVHDTIPQNHPVLDEAARVADPAAQLVGTTSETAVAAARTIGERLGDSVLLDWINAQISTVTEGWPGWAQCLAITAVLAAILIALQKTLWFALRRFARLSSRAGLAKLVSHTGTPAGIFAAGLGLAAAFVLIEARGVMPVLLQGWWAQAVGVWLILAGTWFIIGSIAGIDDLILSRYRIDVRDNLKARRVHTQVRVISRTLMILVGISGIAIALMTFDSVGRIGASLLASAGIAGIAVGFAAKPVLGNIIAGVQIALTQPIRIDDAVIIRGEWGWIEEITTTYVVVKIWDERRLIVPFSTIIEEPFENWTRKSADILGSVVLHVDYACPVDALRDELDRILVGHPKWDGRAKVLQVIDSTERTMTLRVLVTASDSPTAWELRCDVRERLIAFLQRDYRWALPREREERIEPTHGSRDRTGAPREREFDDPTLATAPPPPPTTDQHSTQPDAEDPSANEDKDP